MATSTERLATIRAELEQLLASGTLLWRAEGRSPSWITDPYDVVSSAVREAQDLERSGKADDAEDPYWRRRAEVTRERLQAIASWMPLECLGTWSPARQPTELLETRELRRGGEIAELLERAMRVGDLSRRVMIGQPYQGEWVRFDAAVVPRLVWWELHRHAGLSGAPAGERATSVWRGRVADNTAELERLWGWVDAMPAAGDYVRGRQFEV